MEKLNLSIGILAWKSGQTLVDTLHTYYQNDLFDMVNDITILFQETSDEDILIAEHFGLDYIKLEDNIGIGKGFITLANNCKKENILLLEHDWKLIENNKISYNRLNSGIELLDKEFSCVRYRHRKDPGFPHFSMKHIGNELNYYDEEIECTSPHLLDSVHWLDPAESFPDKIYKDGEYFVTTSRWANWTNNPCIFKKDFYLNIVNDFAGDKISLEGNISRWWAKQNFKVAHGEGLFKHIDLIKYGK